MVKPERIVDRSKIVSEREKMPYLFVEKDRIALEQYRTIALKLEILRQKSPFKTIMITSSIAGEGKTTTSLNLAAIMSDIPGRRVVLLDFDLRRPKIAETIGIKAKYGLETILEKNLDCRTAMIRTRIENLTILPVVNPADDPVSLLSNMEALTKIMEYMKKNYDYILMDVPPILPVSDAVLLKNYADGIIIVVKAGETGSSMLKKAMEIIGREKLIGLILNSTEEFPAYKYEKYGGYYRK